jgi:hypothetical protein
MTYTTEQLDEALAPYETTLPARFRVTSDFFEDASLFATGPSVKFANQPIGNELSAGIETHMPQWELAQVLDVIPNTKTDWNLWNSSGMRIYAATDGADYGLQEWERWSAKNPNAGSKDSCQSRWDAYHSSPPTRTGSGALIKEARRATGNPAWFPSPPITPQGNSNLPTALFSPQPTRPRTLKGGEYDAPTALELMNQHFLIVITGGPAPIARIQSDGSLVYISSRDFALSVSNIFILINGKRVRADKFWLEHPGRKQCKVVFKPSGDIMPDEYNIWRGLSVIPRDGRDKLWRLLRHIYKIICRRNRVKFRYLMRWLAWAVQHPDKPPGTVVVLQSRMQGTGKTTLSDLLRRICGIHARIILDKQRLIGRFNAELETTCWVSAEEMLWAGDRAGGDALKSLITSDTLTLEVKNGPTWEVPNRLHIMMTTNHSHAISAGVKDRRYFVLDVSEEKAQDQSWFGPLHRDLDNGGIEQFLRLLLGISLDGWHPRDLPKTDETIDQQRMSADPISQWAAACIEADAILSVPLGASQALGQRLSIETLRSSFSNYCQQQRLHGCDVRSFGKALIKMFGDRIRLQATSAGGPRPWGYSVPDGDTWQKALDRRLGI